MRSGDTLVPDVRRSNLNDANCSDSIKCSSIAQCIRLPETKCHKISTCVVRLELAVLQLCRRGCTLGWFQRLMLHTTQFNTRCPEWEQESVKDPVDESPRERLLIVVLRSVFLWCGHTFDLPKAVYLCGRVCWSPSIRQVVIILLIDTYRIV